MQVLFLVSRGLLSSRGLSFAQQKEISGVSSEDTNPILSQPHPYDLTQPLLSP